MGAYLLAFAGGMLSFLSPCVLPLVPGYLSLMSGVSTTALTSAGAGFSGGAGAPSTDATSTDTGRLLASTLLFVAGFTVVFVALGATASAFGQRLLEHKQVLTQVSGGLIIAMGLVVAGLVVPRAVQRERRFHVLPRSLGVYAPPVMGMAFAFGWTPCIGPILSVVLATAATSGTLGRGTLMLVAYSAGLGVPFVAAGVGFGRLAGVFGWVKRHFDAINLVSGAFLVAFGVLLLTNRLGEISIRLVQLMEDLGLSRLANI